MLRRLRTIVVLVRVGVHVTAHEAAAVRITVVRTGVEVLATQRDRVTIHVAARTVRRVTTLATTAAALAVAKDDRTTLAEFPVIVVNRLSHRRNHRPRRASPTSPPQSRYPRDTSGR